MLSHSLSRARYDHSEQPEAALVAALRCEETARATGEVGIVARALALQGFISVRRGDLRGGITLVVAAADHADRSGDLQAQAEVAALRAVLSFFTGAYVEAVSEARAALRLADRHGDRDLRLFVRREICPVLGNLGAADLRDVLELTLTLSEGDPREQALSHNDIATMLTEQGEIEPARRALQQAFAHLEEVPEAHYAMAVLHITSAELRLGADDPRGALIDSRRALELLADDSHPNPYLLGAAIQTEVTGLLALGNLDQAQQLGETTLARLGDRVPQTRGRILATLAQALHRAGRFEEAYDTLVRAAQLEREAFRELADAHAELERRSNEMEGRQAQLRDEAERDWLTGLHNRRFLARQLDELNRRVRTGPVSIAILDIDNFKAINDRFGHAVGDKVLVEVAGLLESQQGPNDILVRSGGEEFITVLPETDEHAAVARSEQVRARILGHDWSHFVSGLAVSVSIGVGFTTDSARLRSILEEADDHLYAAKRGGRNRVIARGLS